MKTLFALLLSTVLITACDKPVESDRQVTDLSIIHTSTPVAVPLNQNIVSRVKVAGPNLCYRFAYFTINKQQFTVDVHAKGTYPGKSTMCPQAIYYADTALSVPANTAGQYVIRLFNNDQLFKSDTVLVN